MYGCVCVHACVVFLCVVHLPLRKVVSIDVFLCAFIFLSLHLSLFGLLLANNVYTPPWCRTKALHTPITVGESRF